MPINLAALRRLWSATALIAWNACVIFVFLNLVLAIAFYIKDTYSKPTKLISRILNTYHLQISNLASIYPTLSAEQVNDLLHETWSRPLIFEPFTDLTEAPFKGKYVNVSPNGYRSGLNQGPWPPKRGQDFVVFLFGGSTTFGYGVPDDQTLGSVLQETLSNRLKTSVTVYNFGRGYYYSTQERILFEKLLSYGYVPDLAIFVDGNNDFYNTNRELKFIPTFNGEQKGIYRFLGQVPLVRFVNYTFAPVANFILGNSKTTMTTRDESVAFDQPEALRRDIERYLVNKSMIESVAKGSGSRVLFVWQPTPLYRYSLRHHLFNIGSWGALNFIKYGYPLMRETVEQKPLRNFTWCADIQEGIEEALYVDKMHYTAKLISILTGCIAKAIE